MPFAGPRGIMSRDGLRRRGLTVSVREIPLLRSRIVIALSGYLGYAGAVTLWGVAT